MKTKGREALLSWGAIVASLALVTGQAQAVEDTKIIVLDEIVANPVKFKDTVNVSGRVGKPGINGLFALSCEDSCMAMPVKFSGKLPAEGSNVIVRGRVVKDSGGRYVFNAETVTAKK